ncbi:MAG: hypothetical protein FK730_02285 [Asgard group archaeon]|nr:hypothetical protein [Asgard group archaeon]
MSKNIDNLLGDIYSSSSQSQGVKELANLINNLSQLLLKAISQLEGRVAKLEQQTGRTPRPPQPMAATTPAPMPKAASPFAAPAAPKSTPPPPPQTRRAAPQQPASTGSEPGSIAEAASMLGVTLKKAPTSQPAATSPSSDSGPSFLTSTVDPNAQPSTPSSAMLGTAQPDAVAPVSEGSGIAGPAGGFRGELAEKLARRRQKVQQQIEDDFDSPDLSKDEEEIIEEPADSASSELKTDLEDELRSAFSKLKG